MEVHAPHEPVHTKKEFFTHILIIVIGLVLATLLEQSVVWIEHRVEVRETRQRLFEEREQNIKLFHANVTALRSESSLLLVDLHAFQYLKQHPGTPEENLPGLLYWHGINNQPYTAAWDSATSVN